MDMGKEYQQKWAVLGCPRTARFFPEKISANGKVVGRYIDADGKTFKRFYVGPAEFHSWELAV